MRASNGKTISKAALASGKVQNRTESSSEGLDSFLIIHDKETKSQKRIRCEKLMKNVS